MVEIFEGEAPYPSETERWNGRWYIQSKFHAPQLSGMYKAAPLETDRMLLALVTSDHPRCRAVGYRTKDKC